MAVRTDAASPTGARRGVVAAATAGVASVVLGAGIGELAAAMLAPASSPFSVVGGVLIDLAPTWAKNADEVRRLQEELLRILESSSSAATAAPTTTQGSKP